MELEINKSQMDTTGEFTNGSTKIMFTPTISPEYWVFRVKLFKDQAILGFPKFGTIGIGFAQEDDWNTNLPYQLPTEQIFNHIKHNKKYGEISDDEVKKAIKKVRIAAEQYKNIWYGS